MGTAVGVGTGVGVGGGPCEHEANAATARKPATNAMRSELFIGGGNLSNRPFDGGESTTLPAWQPRDVPVGALRL